MKRASISIPDDLNQQLQEYLNDFEAPPSLASVMQAALREYLQNHQLRLRSYVEAETLAMIPILEGLAHDEPSDVSINHDKYL